jgi:hypothetical protein
MPTKTGRPGQTPAFHRSAIDPASNYPHSGSGKRTFQGANLGLRPCRSNSTRVSFDCSTCDDSKGTAFPCLQFSVLLRCALQPSTCPPTFDVPSNFRRALQPSTCPPTFDVPSNLRRALQLPCALQPSTNDKATSQRPLPLILTYT